MTISREIPEPYASRPGIVDVQPITSLTALRRAVHRQALISATYDVPERIACDEARGQFIEISHHREPRYAKIVRFNGSRVFIQLVAKDLSILERDQALTVSGRELCFLFFGR